jgi:hypothetical protein
MPLLNVLKVKKFSSQYDLSKDKEKGLFTFYRGDTGNFNIPSFQVMLAADDSKCSLLRLLLIGCFNHFCIWHPVFTHPECTFYLKLLTFHEIYSKNPNISSIRPNSNPLVAFPAM